MYMYKKLKQEAISYRHVSLDPATSIPLLRIAKFGDGSLLLWRTVSYLNALYTLYLVNN